MGTNTISLNKWNQLSKAVPRGCSLPTHSVILHCAHPHPAKLPSQSSLVAWLPQRGSRHWAPMHTNPHTRTLNIHPNTHAQVHSCPCNTYMHAHMPLYTHAIYTYVNARNIPIHTYACTQTCMHMCTCIGVTSLPGVPSGIS